jgi:hypothetical protein
MSLVQCQPIKKCIPSWQKSNSEKHNALLENKMSEELKQLILDKRKESKLVHTTIEGFVSVDISEFIRQPADGILYDLNRLEEVALTFIDDPKWVNDFAVALTIRELKARETSARAIMEKFVNKVDTGMARSKETYAEMKAWLEE